MAAQNRRLGKGLGALFPALPGESLNANVSRETSDEAKTEPAKKVAGQSSAAQQGSGASVKPAASSKPVAKQTSAPSEAESAKSKASKAPDKKKPAAKAMGRAVMPKIATAHGNRPAMPSLSEAVNPIDMFFGEGPVTPPKPAAETKPASPKGGEEDEPEMKPVEGGYLAELDVKDIAPNDHQPRTVFDEDELDELARSIKEVGILQPIVVRKRVSVHPDGHKTFYELIMGERRWRATQRAGLNVIPAIVKTTADDDMLRDALLENLHRVALNPLEEAAAYQQMIDEFGLTQAQLSQSVSKSRPQIANTLRLLQLPASVQKKVAANVLSAGHARALLSLADPEEMEKLADRIIAEGLSVRSTEEIVAMQTAKNPDKKKAKPRKDVWAGSETVQTLENRFDTKVMIRGTKKRGKIEISFASEEDFGRIMQLLNSRDAEPNADGWV
ncbi:ParB/RepB/Spo0J family partition protein [Bifidobacterium simiarum]|uniref:Chromosome partitioning protein ParB n=1 Tax=Bifidobacterium simiarum TaxID=2045441 RepID=A0A2M9HGI7_9BIFI|nr:ParB/RepB/Spo0J family partition protein [Bifidobacterium simiarum]PJM75926.1 chromosome partitioning protein ParB [Bifidobacterium simiarum]